MIGSIILLATMVIVVLVALSILLYGTVKFFIEGEYLGGILCAATIIFAIGSTIGLTLSVFGI